MFLGGHLAAIGCTFVPTLAELERLSGDRLLLLQAPNSTAEGPLLEQARTNPRFEQRPAVQAGRVLVLSRLSISLDDGIDDLLVTQRLEHFLVAA